MKTQWLLSAWLGVAAWSLVEVAPAAHAVETARKPRPKRRAVTKKKPTPRRQTPSENAEQALHQDRLAVIARLKDVNNELKDAELAAIVERIRQKEQQRHTLARQVIKREQEGGK